MTDDNGSGGKDRLEFDVRLSALLNELRQSDFVFEKAGLADFAGVPYGLQLLAVMAHGAAGHEATRQEQEDAETLATVAREKAFAATTQLRDGSAYLNSFWGLAKWISALVMPLPGLATAH